MGGDYVVPVQPASGVHGAALTLVPPYPSYPPEEAFTRTGDSGLPLLVLAEGNPGEGRRVFWPGNVDSFFLSTNAPDFCRLLRNSIEWAFRGQQPAQLSGPGLIEMHPYRQAQSLQVHLVNFTNPDIWRAPVHELLPVGEQIVRVRVPQAISFVREARCLVSGQTLPVTRSGEWVEAVLPGLLDHEIVVFDLAE